MGIRTYGTDLDKEVLRQSTEAREIVAQIMNYGVTQQQIIYIISDLAMNLENPNHIKKIRNVCKEIAESKNSISIEPVTKPKKSPIEV